MTQVTPRHSDAIGYALDLAHDVSQDWFSLASDLAVQGCCSAPDEYALSSMVAMCRDQASYLRQSVSTPPPPAPTTPIALDRLEELSGFTDFKRLDPDLSLRFGRRITIVFGCNGSGKSSACDALKVLARPEGPERPITNARQSSGQPSFSYKFRNDAALQTWTSPGAFGVRQDLVKYFDSTVATRNITAAVEPGRLIALAPFQLQVFENLKRVVDEVRETLRSTEVAVTSSLTTTLAAVNAAFSPFDGRALKALSTRTIASLDGEITLGVQFAKDAELQAKREALVELRRSSSEEGLSLIQAEKRELHELIGILQGVADGANAVWASDCAQKVSLLAEKIIEQQKLAETIVPPEKTLTELKQLLISASSLVNFEDPAGDECPLCNRPLGDPEIELFARYYELVGGALEQEILTLEDEVRTAKDEVDQLAALAKKDVDGYRTVGVASLEAAKSLRSKVCAACLVDSSPSEADRAALNELRNLIGGLSKAEAAKAAAITAASVGKVELEKQEKALMAQLEPLEYASAVRDNLDLLRTARGLAGETSELAASLQPFPALLRKITETSKTAHEELVVGDFTSRLDDEYKKLTEKDMAHFGVDLMRTGSEVVVTVRPRIGQCGIPDVLSEGELRVHALALFFAESCTCSESVFVFDDPVSSFDYDYTANYCGRLRDLAKQRPDRQIIVLTHNWEFFVQLQNTLNKAQLGNELSVQVLENCSTVAEYSEKIDELKAEVSLVLAGATEPDKATKERMAGNMRRLIESVVNTHVFRGQRQQYRQRSHSVSNFSALTGLVPLLDSEATELADLYAKLSISEHDDARNAYVNTDKAMFQSRYDRILAVEQAVVARRV